MPAARKRALQLNEEDDDEPRFVAPPDGPYRIEEMPKRIHRGYTVGVVSARIRALEAEDERDSAVMTRLISQVRAITRDMMANHQAATAAHHTPLP